MVPNPKPRNLFPHGAPPRGLDTVPRSRSHEGRFGRLFRNLPPLLPDDTDLEDLAKTLVENNVDVEKDANARSNNARISAGFTYFGQFVDHDLTFDPTSKLQRDNDPDALRNFRTPRFDLDSVYGSGPADSPFLYEKDGIHFVIGKNSTNEDDLPRNPATPARALTGDPRNDENMIVSQLHLAFLKFHNKVADSLNAGGFTGDLFDESRTLVRWHYQWIVIHDFLRLITSRELVESILKKETFKISTGGGLTDATIWKPDLRFYRWEVNPFIPVEFSVAAYRFGHSMVRRDYALNLQTSGENADGAPKEIPIFSDGINDLTGFRSRPADRKIEWFRFFSFPGHDADLQPARAIDTLLVFGLSVLPGTVAADPPPSLAERNLKRGKSMGLPSGQDVAQAMGIPEKFIVSLDNRTFTFGVGTSYKVPNGTDEPSVPALDSQVKTHLEGVFGRATPLWYYVLKEAELIGNGERLGPAGGRIVAETIIGLLIADRFSYLNLAPTWIPRKGSFGCKKDGEFSITDLLQFIA